MSWSRIKHILLTLLIALSLFLSFQMWTAGQEIRESSSTSSSTAPASLVDRTLSEVFAPNKIIWHRNLRGEVLEGNTYYMQDWINDRFEEMTFGEMDSPQRMTREDYQNAISTDEWAEFIYDAPVPFGLFEEAFENLPTDYQNRTFTHLFLNVNNTLQIGFYDSHNELMYALDESSITEEMMTDLLYSSDNNFTQVETFEVSDSIIYLPVEESEVEYHDYLVERLPNNLYVNQFFADTSEVDARRTGNSTRYIDLTTELRINDATNTLTYLRQRTDAEQMAFSDRLIGSFQELRQIENWTETIHYNAYYSESQHVSFQRYIQGFPVFSYQDLESTVLVRVVESGLTDLRSPVRVVQTPITLSGEETKTLQSGSDVIEELERTELGLEVIQDIRKGLTWVESEEDSRVVHFEPAWYIQTQNNWFELDRYIQIQEESPNGL